MSQPESVDEGNPRPTLEDSEAVSVGETAAPLTKGLPWAFWIWQCVPMVCLIIGMPPGENANKWIHISAVDWIAQQPWINALLAFIAGIMLSQGILLAYWMVWGAGKWTSRFCKVMGLAAIATLLPAIWFKRHVSIFRDGTNPWSEALDPLFLSIYFLGYLTIAFLPALLSLCMFHQMGFRLKEIRTPKSLQQARIFSWKEILTITTICLFVIVFFYLNYLGNVAWLARIQIPQPGSTLVLVASFSTVMSTTLAATLSVLILKLNDGRVTAAIFGSLFGLYISLALWQTSSFVPNPEDNFLTCTFHLGVALTLCILTSLANARIFIGHRRFAMERNGKSNGMWTSSR